MPKRQGRRGAQPLCWRVSKAPLSRHSDRRRAGRSTRSRASLSAAGDHSGLEPATSSLEGKTPPRGRCAYSERPSTPAWRTFLSVYLLSLNPPSAWLDAAQDTTSAGDHQGLRNARASRSQLEGRTDSGSRTSSLGKAFSHRRISRTRPCLVKWCKRDRRHPRAVRLVHAAAVMAGTPSVSMVV